jgi:hypothetical protein
MGGYRERVAFFRDELTTAVLYQMKYLVQYLCNVQDAPLILDVAFLFSRRDRTDCNEVVRLTKEHLFYYNPVHVYLGSSHVPDRLATDARPSYVSCGCE